MQDLPKHLSRVNWHKLQDRLEVHELLDVMQESIPEIPIHVRSTAQGWLVLALSSPLFSRWL